MTEGSPVAAPTPTPNLPAAQRSRPSWRKHTWLASQAVWLQVMMPWTEQVQMVVQVFSVYQLSPNCGAWPSSAEPIGNLETGEGWSPPQPRRVTAFGPLPSLIFSPSFPPSFPSRGSFLPALSSFPFYLLLPLPPPFSFCLSSYLFSETRSHSAAQDALEFMTFPLQPSTSWDARHAPPLLVLISNFSHPLSI